MQVLANIPKSINLIIHTNWLKDKKLHHHLNQCKKAIWQNPTFCRDKNLIECRTKGSRHQHSKVYVWQTQHRMTTNVILNGEFLKVIPLKSAKHQGCSVSPLIFNMVLKTLAEENNKKGKLKRYKWGRSNHPYLHTKNSQISTRPPEMFSTFSKERIED